ncbi:efflux RND transporter periplasmic adaptor subunit [Steroidobacter sp. S1-65]|uniref:Efflux RND transporter periplasmic adaptor subunit n=1 Tax=Steroidobacter gossypii TaxID=2805490 RepID=A0ABS1WTA3_9GAMM|nr:efflux RND transporter periplasmic adaptor subunit [Steroidobacter gossypii]MBM0104215.1 efflux RND transporter periplasmic adaptor subunit [Steroidobacter gossypii]
MDTETSQSTDLSRTLRAGLHEPPAWQRFLKWGLLALILIAAAYFTFGRDRSKEVSYVTQDVVTGDLTVSVTATGNLEPRNQVEIGSELSGTVAKVHVDVNHEVKAGQVLAELDTTRLKAQVLQAESSLESAQARVLQADASAKEAKANLARLQKVRELSGNKLPSQQDMDVAEAAVARAEGELAAAKAAVSQARASLETIRTDLGKTEIRSPINGVILVRSVEPGQTVAASLQAPVLFIMAEDLKKMELHVSVDEADVGAVEVGQEASFTVDAYPNRRFNAHITQVHFASSNTKSSASSSSSSASSSATSTGVVTYETVLEVDNPELLLRPGMTATAEIVTTHITDAVLVPNAALRFAPETPQAPPQRGGGPLSMIMPRMRFGGPRGQQQQGQGRRMGRAYILEEGKPALVMFRAGATDGRMTQVLPFERPPNVRGPEGGGDARPPAGGMRMNGPGAAGLSPEEMRKAFERKLEPGTKVIVDSGAPTP